MILVFGSINVDLAARVQALPRPGETIPGRDLAVSPGGKGANQALAARRAGAEVALAGAVGDDAFAATALALLDAGGVDLAHVRRIGGTTGVALVLVDASGDNAITVVPGANAGAASADVPDEALAVATTLMLQLETPAAESLALAQRARARGLRTMLNAAPATPLDAGWLDAVSVLVVNAIEARTLAPAFGVPDAPAAFAATLARAHGLDVVVTLGGDGALAAAGGALHRVPTPAVAVADTVGAGDAFTGALAAALDRGERWPRALACAAAAGALACTRAGAQAALADRAAIDAHATPLESCIVSEELAA